VPRREPRRSFACGVDGKASHHWTPALLSSLRHPTLPPRSKPGKQHRFSAPPLPVPPKKFLEVDGAVSRAGHKCSDGEGNVSVKTEKQLRRTSMEEPRSRPKLSIVSTWCTDTSWKVAARNPTGQLTPVSRHPGRRAAANGPGSHAVSFCLPRRGGFHGALHRAPDFAITRSLRKRKRSPASERPLTLLAEE